LYGRGMFNSQANSMFGSTFFGYHMGERYQIHAYIDANHNKMGENGGLESDIYITDPQSLPQRYGSRDIPTALTETWNRNDGETYFLTHRYRMGFYREVEVPDSLKPQMPPDYELLDELPDSLLQAIDTDTLLRRQLVDSLRLQWQNAQVPPREFVPVSLVNHSFRARTMRHRYYSYADDQMDYHTSLYYGDPADVRNRVDGLEIENTLSLGMIEGFNKWAAMGITLFATHHLETYRQPETVGDTVAMKRNTLQKVYVGGRITRRRGSLLHYDAMGRFVAAGKDMGEFDVDATVDLNFRLGRKDTVALIARGYVKNQKPAWLLRHYHSQFAWWDNDLDKEFRTRIEGTLGNRRTKTSLTVGVENIKNAAYLAIESTLTGDNPASTLTADYTREVRSRQYSGSVQLLAVGLKQDFHIGKPLHWDNEVWFQTTSKPDILPLPSWNLYSNLYLKFRIAKTLNVQLGGDIRYFTAYYAPDYSPVANSFAVQDASHPRVKLGNYPIVNAYANLHLKRCRLYVCARHVNSGNGRRFWAPHYAMDPLTINFGLSWNFFD
ncbi:MAG: putative porin, partial [Bacteroidaceae bacterium]|nr:putative porin [Bacteroidaceae bacterium]